MKNRLFYFAACVALVLSSVSYPAVCSVGSSGGYYYRIGW